MAVRAYKADTSSHDWSQQKIDGHSKLEAYNKHLSGKILIPQPFGELRNYYEPESGFCISKFMVIQVVVALLLVAVFSWLGSRVQGGRSTQARVP